MFGEGGGDTGMVVKRKKEMIKVKCKILKHAIHTCSPYYSGTHVHLHVGTRVCTTQSSTTAVYTTP